MGKLGLVLSLVGCGGASRAFEDVPCDDESDCADKGVCIDGICQVELQDPAPDERQLQVRHVRAVDILVVMDNTRAWRRRRLVFHADTPR